jgi:hypothetical protein
LEKKIFSQGLEIVREENGKISAHFSFFPTSFWDNLPIFDVSIVFFPLKCIVQRKPRRVEICNNGQILLMCWGAVHYFLMLKGNRLLDLAKNVLPPLEPKLLVM